MGISGLTIQALPKQNSASMNTAQNQQRLERLNHEDNWCITYLQLYVDFTDNFVFYFCHCLNVSSLSVKSIKPDFLWFAVHASKIHQDFCIFLSWQPRFYIGHQRKEFFGEFWFWGSFQRNRWIRRKSCVIDPKKRQGIAAQLRGQGEARWLSCISFWRQAFWKTSRFSLRQKQEFTLLKYVES